MNKAKHPIVKHGEGVNGIVIGPAFEQSVAKLNIEVLIEVIG